MIPIKALQIEGGHAAQQKIFVELPVLFVDVL